MLKPLPSTAADFAPPPTQSWTFLSNHAHVLYCLAAWPNIRLREVALKAGITERAVQRIVSDLEEAGYLIRQRVGRQNQYRMVMDLNLRHPLEDHIDVGQLLGLLTHPSELAANQPDGD